MEWLKGEKKVWCEPTNHFNDCYLCLTNSEGFSKKQKQKIQYPNVPSSLKPVPDGAGLSVPTPPLNWDDIYNSDDNEQVIEGPPETSDPIYSLETSNEPHLIKQKELNDLVPDLDLSKQ
jgi:hypothetical protein